MTPLLVAAILLSVVMGGAACMVSRWRERIVRWTGFAVCGLGIVYAVGQIDWSTNDMAKMKGTVASLRKDAETAIAAKDWPAVDAVLDKLKTAKPNGEREACQLRGQMFRLRGSFARAQVEYQKAYDLGDHVASGSVIEMIRLQKEAKP